MSIYDEIAKRIVAEFRPDGWPAKEEEIARLLSRNFTPFSPSEWPLNTEVRKKSGSEWRGHVVGYYSTELTPHGIVVESDQHYGSVQLYPTKAMEKV